MDKTLIDLGFLSITWYAVFIVSGIGIGLFLAIKELKHHLLDKDLFFDYVFYVIIFALLGARIWYVTFEWQYYSQNILDVFKIYNGGIAIHGGIIGGLLYTLYFAKKKKVKLFLLTDLAITALLIGQAIGRWGNFVNQEAHGGATTEAFLQSIYVPQFVINGMQIDQVFYQPTFLYESIWNFIGFLIVIVFLRPKFRKSYGILTGFYLMWYGFIRFFIEMMRTDALTLGFIKVAQFTSFVMFVSGICLLIYLARRKNEKNRI